MPHWPNTRILELFKTEFPIFQAPMAGVDTPELVVEVCEGGGLGFLACALLTSDQIEEQVAKIREKTSRPFGLNFFCHSPPQDTTQQESIWRKHLEKYYLELGIESDAVHQTPARKPFDSKFCKLLERIKPSIVSFHFGLPEATLVERLKKSGIKLISSATTVLEGQWLEKRGCDGIIAQGYEAGGHRGMFLTENAATQIGTMALVPQIVDAVKVPVIAAGGIADGRGIAASFMLGASAVQLGTAFLFCPESQVSNIYRKALLNPENETVLTNVFSGRPARGILNRLVRETGPFSSFAPPFPQAGAAVAPLRKYSETHGSPDFMQLWSGQAALLGREMPAKQLTRLLAAETLKIFEKI